MVPEWTGRKIGLTGGYLLILIIFANKIMIISEYHQDNLYDILSLADPHVVSLSFLYCVGKYEERWKFTVYIV